MKKQQYSRFAIYLCVIGVIFLIALFATKIFAATAPNLGAVAPFSVLAQTGITGISTISGDVGNNATGAQIPALTAVNVGGTIFSSDGVAPGLAILPAAVQADALAAFTIEIPGMAPTASLLPVLDAQTVTTGVYDIGAGRLNGGVLTLDGPGIYVFRASSDLISSGSIGSINFTNGARACDLFWRVETLATINGSTFAGTILAGTGVHFGANVTLDGRALAIGGDVTMITDTINGPSCAVPPPPPPPAPAPAPSPSGQHRRCEYGMDYQIGQCITPVQIQTAAATTTVATTTNVLPLSALPNTGVSIGDWLYSLRYTLIASAVIAFSFAFVIIGFAL